MVAYTMSLELLKTKKDHYAETSFAQDYGRPRNGRCTCPLARNRNQG